MRLDITRKTIRTDLLARLKPAVTLEQAQANLESIAINLDKLYPVPTAVHGNNRADATKNRQRHSPGPACIAWRGRICVVDCVCKCRKPVAGASAGRQREIAIRIALAQAGSDLCVSC